MSESIWWPDLPWWERKVPVARLHYALVQAARHNHALLSHSLCVSSPFEFPIAGFSFGGRAAVFCAAFGAGYTISSRRVKLIPQLQAFYTLRTRAAMRNKKEAGDQSPAG